jgi:uncharacterized Fe-S radical SAM superfamily protein PflX
MGVSSRPAYLKLLENGELRRRVQEAWRHLQDCDLCARYCRGNRSESVTGAVCRSGDEQPDLVAPPQYLPVAPEHQRQHQ